MRALLTTILILFLSLGHTSACTEGINAINKVVNNKMHPASSADAAVAIRSGGMTQDGLIFKNADGLTDVKPATEVLVKRGGDKGWTRGTVTGTDPNGRVLVDFVEDGIGKTKPVSAGNVATNIKLYDEQASLMAPGKRVVVARNGGGSSSGYVTSYDNAGNARVDFFDEKSGSWAHKIITPDKINDVVQPMSKQPLLRLTQGESVDIFSRTDGAYNTGKITKIDDAGNVHLSYELKDGRVATKTISAQSIDQVLKPVSKVDDAGSVGSIFAKSPVHNQPQDSLFSAGREMPDGTRSRVSYLTDNREIAKSQGKLFEGVTAKELPKGKSYTYIVKSDGKMVFGQVDDGWEVGVKHAHLANGEDVMAAGELSIDASGAFRWNLESGSYTRKLVQGGQTDMATLEKQMRKVFQGDLGDTGKYVDDILLNSGPPTSSNIKIYCANPHFKMLNMSICEGFGI